MKKDVGGCIFNQARDVATNCNAMSAHVCMLAGHLGETSTSPVGEMWTVYLWSYILNAYYTIYRPLLGCPIPNFWSQGIGSGPVWATWAAPHFMLIFSYV